MYVPDASVWVARFWRNDPRHADAYEWLQRATQSGQPIYAPTFLLAEVSGAISRRVGTVRSAQEAVREIRTMSTSDEITFFELDEELLNESVDIAARYRLRGADAIYVAVAHVANSTLVTLDNEQRDRAAGLVETITIPRTGD